MTKKKVTAPLTYNPGKGRPKEHLAYLNYQEMQALKRLNGNNMERGPKGLPSFPPADAIGSSSRASSTSKTSGPSSSLSAPVRTAPSTSRPSGSGFAGIGGGRDSGQAAARQTAARQATQTRFAESSRGTASVSRISGGTPGGNQRDAQFKAAAESRSISKAVQTPALKQDAGRSAIGGISKDKSVGLADGSRIRGAIQGVKDLGIAGVPGVSRIGVPTATIKTPTARQFPSLPAGAPGGMSMYQPGKTSTETGAAIGNYVKSYEMAKLVKEAYPNIKESVDKVASMYNTLSVAMPGEAYVTKYGEEGIRDLSRVATNMLARNLKTDEVLSNMDTLGLRPGTEKFRLGEKAGGEGMGVVPTGSDYQSAAISEMEKGIRGIGVSPVALDATNFWAAGTPAPRGPAGDVPPVGKPVRGTQFGVDPIAREAVIRRNIAARDVLNPYVDPFRAAGAEKTIAERTSPAVVITPASATPERRVTPGLIQYPRLDRPEAPPPRPPTAGRSAVVPTVRPSKIITDRVLQEPSYRPYDIRVTSPPAPLMDVSFEAGLEGKIQDRILPQSEYAGYGDFTPPQITAGLSRNPFETQISGQYSGYGPFTPPVRTANLDRNVYDAGRAPSTYSGITNFNVPDRTADIARNQFDTLVSPPRYSGYGEFTVPTQEKNLGVETLVDANIARNPYDVQRSAEAQTPESLVGSRQIKIDGIGTLSIEDALKTVPENKREAVRQELALEYESGVTTFSKENFDSLVKRAEYDPNFDYSGLEAASEPDSTAVTPDGYLEEEAGVDESELATPDKPGEELTQEQEQKLKETLKRGGLGIRIGAGVLGAAGVPFAGLAGGYLSRQYQKNKIEQIKQYAAMTDAQKLAAEKRNPELVGWAHRLGIDSVNDYDFYQSWADKSGLRGTPSREGGGPGGIASLGGGSRDDDQTGGSPTPDTPSTPSGRRPDIYYMWDLGVNIPSPGDPNYTQYQTYLAERLAAQQAMGYV